jgi:queuosine precursor transporter
MTLTPKSVFWTLSYVISILAVNWLFAPAQLVEGVTFWKTAWGDLFLANLVVGAVFVLRDYAQREIGHRILVATLLAGVLTYFMVDPAIAIASLVAFVISETADWGVFSFWKKSMQSRILVSSLIAVPLDTVVFQHLAGYLTPAAFVMEVLSKAVGVFIVWQLLKMREANVEVKAV